MYIKIGKEVLVKAISESAFGEKLEVEFVPENGEETLTAVLTCLVRHAKSLPQEFLEEMGAALTTLRAQK